MQALLNGFLSRPGGKKLLLLRHGEVQAGGPEKRFIGQSDPPLSETGRRQARNWADRFQELPMDRIVSSDLDRCLQTARIIAAGGPPTVTPMPALREIHLGRWEKMTFAQVESRWPDAFMQRGRDLEKFRPPDGESFADLRQRVIPVFHQLADHPARSTLVVGHAGVIRVILCHLLGMPPANLFRLAQDHGALNLIEGRNDGFRVHAVNLPPAPWAGDRCADG